MFCSIFRAILNRVKSISICVALWLLSWQYRDMLSTVPKSLIFSCLLFDHRLQQKAPTQMPSPVSERGSRKRRQWSRASSRVGPFAVSIIDVMSG